MMANLATRPVPSSHSVQPDSAALRLRLIGQMGAWGAGSHSVLPAGRKTRALLAIIAMSGTRPALRGRLAELLWSRRPEEQARASLRQEIHRLQEALNPLKASVLQITRDHLTLRPGIAWIDLEEVMAATVARPAALSLLEGDLLEDLDGADPAFDTWLTTERERLRDHGRGLAEALLREQDDPDTTIPAAQRLLAIDRAHEGAWRALMRAHAARGERGMAIQSYDRCRAVLADLLDAEPSIETQKLLAEIRGAGHARAALRPLPTQRAGTPEEEPALLARQPDAVKTATRGIRIGVLPFRHKGAGAEEAHPIPEIAEEITTLLSPLRSVAVVSSNALARFAAEHSDEEAIRRAFDLDYLLDGSIQRIHSRLRVSARLLDLGAHNQVVWARRFDRQAEDPLALQDDIAAEIVAQVEPAILLIEGKRAGLRDAAGATAEELMLRALPRLGRMEQASFAGTGELLRRAIEFDPAHAPAHAWLAFWTILQIGQGWASQPQASIAEAGRLAERAVQLDPSDARALTIAGHVSAALQHRLHEAASLHERALALNPNLAMAWALSAATHAFLGDMAEAQRRADRYKALTPLHPFAFFFDGYLAAIQLLERNDAAAVGIGRTVTQMNPLFSAGFKPYLAALGHLGRRQEAAVALRRLLTLEPQFSIERFMSMAPFATDTDRKTFAEGLRLAGVPDSAAGAAPVPLRA